MNCLPEDTRKSLGRARILIEDRLINTQIIRFSNFRKILVEEEIRTDVSKREHNDSWIAIAIVPIHPRDSCFPFDIALAFTAGRVQWRR